MRFHILGLPHLPTRKEISPCAYTQKVVKLCYMLKTMLGHEVIFYGVAGSEVDANEMVEVVSRDTWGRCYGDYDWRAEQFRIGENSEAFKEFNRRASKEVVKRRVERDFLLCSQGVWNKPISDAVGASVITVESGIGYEGVFAKFRVFESYAWMHWIYGKLGISNGLFYDAVIPNYYDLEDFPLCEEKGQHCLFVGRLVHRKGLVVAVQATERLGVPLLVAGQRTDEDLSELFEEPHVKYIGTLNPEDRAREMGQARAVFVPTFYIEPFGGVNVEAQLCVLPQTFMGLSGVYFEDAVNGMKVESENGRADILETFKHNYNGKIFEVKGLGCLPFTITSGHEVKIAKVERVYHPDSRKKKTTCYWKEVKKLQWKEVNEITNNDYLVIPKMCDIVDVDEIRPKIISATQSRKDQANITIPTNHDMMRFFGYYVAEGGSGYNRCKLYFGQHEIDIISDVKKIIEDNLPYKVNVRDIGASTCVSFGGNVLARFLRSEFGHNAEHKKIPDWVLYAPLDKLQCFLEGYIEGDGCHTGGTLSMNTTSKLLSIQLQKAFMRFGIFISITHDKRHGTQEIKGRVVNMNDRYLIRSKKPSIFNDRIGGKPENSRVLEDGNNYYVPIMYIRASNYDGMVYNIHTTNGTYCLHNCLVHNCGTPVITTDWGAFTETVIDDVTGFRCHTLAEFCDAVIKAGDLEPSAVHSIAASRYSLEAIAPKYQDYFERLYQLWEIGWIT